MSAGVRNSWNTSREKFFALTVFDLESIKQISARRF